jgi:osmotically-inducible protein OsmY
MATIASTNSNALRFVSRECHVCASVEGRLQRSSYRALRRIRCDFQGDSGVLHLRGSLPSYYLKQVAQELVGGVEGVLHVDNQISVNRTSCNA